MLSYLYLFLVLSLVGELPQVKDPSLYEQRNSIELQPLKVGVIGLVHTHVHWILGRENIGDIEIVAIVEPNRELAEKYADQHGYSMDIVYETMEEMVQRVEVEAVTAFNTIYDHLEVVEFCAPRGIHVMVEKPLAVNVEHALKMAELASKYNIHLLTNYETSWYPSTHLSHEVTRETSNIGSIRKMKFYTGHPGPIEIGCNNEFLEWLTDPVLNGGGALTDFGCYGANISTWLMNGEKPVSITATTNQLKPEKYPKVEDDALILINYKNSQSVIDASWNWSHNRKDMEIYGINGYIECVGGNEVSILVDEMEGPYKASCPPLADGLHDPFALLHKVVRDQHQLPPFDLNGIDNNLMVMKILELAKISAKEGRTVNWSEYYE